MARNGHPRVPRKIRGERRRMQRQIEQARGQGYFGLPRFRPHVPNRALAAWEQELLQTGKSGAVLPVNAALLNDVYDPMIRAQLMGPLTLPTPMSQRG